MARNSQVIHKGGNDLEQFFTKPVAYTPAQEGPLLQRHEGGSNGFHSMLVRLPEQQGLIVLLSNG